MNSCKLCVPSFSVFRPNMAVKGTRRTQAVFKVGGLFRFVGFGLVMQPARPLLLR
jgi:hypothetical protein